MLTRIKTLVEYFQKVWGVEAPRWDYLQVEVTSRCQTPGCVMCPRTAWPARWQPRDLSWEIFEALLASAQLFSQAHLSGWGEPLLHPRLWDMARALQAQGVKVSLTTNGLGLNPEIQKLVLEHLDMVAISVDAARPETYEKIRPGSDFQRVIDNIAALCSSKRTLGQERPEVVLLFLKMRPNLAELPEFLRLAASLGVDRVNAPNLDFIPIPEMDSLSLLTLNPPDPELETISQEAVGEAQRLGLPFRDFSLALNFDLRVCDANPLRQVFVTASGDVAPCVYLGLPVEGSFTRRYFRESYSASNYFYGNVAEDSLEGVLKKPAYLNFIDYFKTPTAIFALLQAATSESRAAEEIKKAHPFAVGSGRWPPPCHGCLKSLGA